MILIKENPLVSPSITGRDNATPGALSKTRRAARSKAQNTDPNIDFDIAALEAKIKETLAPYKIPGFDG